jgi:hypothetical protein
LSLVTALETLAISVLAPQAAGLQFDSLAGYIIAKTKAAELEAPLALVLRVSEFLDWMMPGAIVWVGLEDLEDFAEQPGKVRVVLCEAS